LRYRVLMNCPDCEDTEPTTEAYGNFCSAQGRMFEFMYFVNNAARTHYESSPFRRLKSEQQTAQSPSQSFDDLLGAHAKTISEVIICRLVDNFDHYIERLLYEAILSMPKGFIGASETVTIHSVLHSASTSAFRDQCAQRAANKFGRKDLAELRTELLRPLHRERIRHPS